MQRKAGACRRFGAASLDLCMVARGWMDGYWERSVHPWDVTAGALLVKEAGGTVTSWDGSPFDSHHDQGEVLASNGGIHKELIHELAAAARAAV
jgi:myo-inositol-1(or 4)-monophosphatase